MQKTSTDVVELELDVGPLTIAAQRFGNVDGPKVLALHGWLDNAMSFAPLREHLAAFDVVAIDMPGHGLSQHLPPAASYHFMDGLQHIDAVIDKLGWKHFHLLGHSMGAGIGLLYAGAMADHLESIILIDTVGPLVETAAKTVKRLHKSIRIQRALANKQPRVYPTLEEAILARQQDSDLDFAACELLAQRGVKQVEGGWQWRHDMRLLVPSLLRPTEEQAKAFVSSVTCPVQVIYGDHGLFHIYPAMRERIALFPNAESHVLNGGHHLHMSAPGPVGKLIQTFIKKPHLV